MAPSLWDLLRPVLVPVNAFTLSVVVSLYSSFAFCQPRWYNHTAETQRTQS